MRVFFLILLLFLSSARYSFANSDYVLPYPSAMPGNKLYKLLQLKDELMGYWYFGSYGQFTYQLTQADKYIVEAKTLFEYEQYLLGNIALQKSNDHFQQLPQILENARKEQKDISEKKDIFQKASQKHIEVLIRLKSEVPESFNWQPEKMSATKLNLKENIDNAIKIRSKGL